MGGPLFVYGSHLGFFHLNFWISSVAIRHNCGLHLWSARTVTVCNDASSVIVFLSCFIWTKYENLLIISISPFISILYATGLSPFKAIFILLLSFCILLLVSLFVAVVRLPATSHFLAESWANFQSITLLYELVPATQRQRLYIWNIFPLTLHNANCKDRNYRLCECNFNTHKNIYISLSKRTTSMELSWVENAIEHGVFSASCHSSLHRREAALHNEFHFYVRRWRHAGRPNNDKGILCTYMQFSISFSHRVSSSRSLRHWILLWNCSDFEIKSQRQASEELVILVALAGPTSQNAADMRREVSWLLLLQHG